MATDITDTPAPTLSPGAGPRTAPDQNREIHAQLGRKYDAGFVTDIESDSLPAGLDEDTIRALSAKKEEPEWMTQWRLEAYRHWLTMPVPHWAKLSIAPIDFQAISYYSAPKGPKYKSLDDVPKELLDTYDKLGVPLHERAKLAGVAVDAVFDSVSVGTTFRKELAEQSGLEIPTVAKVLRPLAQAGLVEGFRGAGGGYRLARDAAAISLVEIVEAMEGPLGMTECSLHDGACGIEQSCGVRANWRRINDVVVDALRNVSLAQMIDGVPPAPAPQSPSRRIDLRLANA